VYLDDDDRLTLTTQFDELGLDIDTAVPLGLIANELITNALKYAFPDGRAGKIELRLVKEATCFRLFVADNGIGIPLSTEGKPVKKRSSFGLELVDSLVEKLNGQLIFTNQNGTKTELIVPFATQKPVIAA
jgi:two-component sensor histidine kinase